MLVQARVRSERAAGPKRVHTERCCERPDGEKHTRISCLVLLAKSLAILVYVTDFSTGTDPHRLGICNRHYFCPNFTPVPSSTRPCILTKARSLV